VSLVAGHGLDEFAVADAAHLEGFD
jgi:hypothetical protein